MNIDDLLRRAMQRANDGMTSTTNTDSPPLTYEAVRQAIDSLLPLVQYVASEYFPENGDIIVIDKQVASEKYPILMGEHFGSQKAEYLVYCHPSQVPALTTQLRNVARLEPLRRIDESESDDAPPDFPCHQ